MSPLSVPIPVYNVDRMLKKQEIITKFTKVTVEIKQQSRNYIFLVTALGTSG